MMRHAKAQIADCNHCLWFKCKPENVALEIMQTTHTLEIVLLDYLTTEATEGGKKCMCVNHHGSPYELYPSLGYHVTDCQMHSSSIMR